MEFLQIDATCYIAQDCLSECPDVLATVESIAREARADAILEGICTKEEVATIECHISCLGARRAGLLKSKKCGRSVVGVLRDNEGDEIHSFQELNQYEIKDLDGPLQNL